MAEETSEKKAVQSTAGLSQRSSGQSATPESRSKIQSSGFPAFVEVALFASVNIAAAATAPILDCDEVFNYWEPTHYLDHGYGLQTWEYSPQYAIRSWLYIAIHAIPGKVASLVTGKSPLQFYFVRILLGLACAYCQGCLFRAISKEYGKRVARIFQLAMLSSSGTFYASVAFLPSSFAMMTAMLGTAAFLDRPKGSKIHTGLVWFGIGAIIGWPFSAALIGPLLLDELVYVHVIGLADAVSRGIRAGLWLSLVIMLDVAVNTLFYRKLVFVPWGIVSYNVFGGSSRGPDIFGTEPWHFYIRNLLLNFNLWFLLAMSSGPIITLQLLIQGSPTTRMSNWRNLIFSIPFYLWLAIFTMQPHKEERFMYPAYPFLCLNAAVAAHNMLFYWGHIDPRSIIGRVPSQIKLVVVVASAALAVSIGVLRTAGTVTAYRAPLQIYGPLQDPELVNMTGNVCLGKEWYRFPSSYFLPLHMRARFIKSAFNGLLPGQFHESEDEFGLLPPTWLVPPGMNDRNEEDVGKHIDKERCSFLIDSYMLSTHSTPLEPNFISDPESWETWKRVKCVPFLDVAATRLLPRLLWVPNWNIIARPLQRKWGTYCLLQRKQGS